MGVLLPPLPLPAFIPALGCIRLLSTLIQQSLAMALTLRKSCWSMGLQEKMVVSYWGKAEGTPLGAGN